MGIGTDEDEQRFNNYIDEQYGKANFLAELRKRTPEQQDIFKRQLYRSYVDENALATDELMMAEELRSGNSQGFDNGNVFVANVGGGIGDMAENYVAGGMRNAARADLEELAASKLAGRTEVANLTQDAARADLEEQAASKLAGRTEVANLTQDAANTVADANDAQKQQHNFISFEQQQAMSNALRKREQDARIKQR